MKKSSLISFLLKKPMIPLAGIVFFSLALRLYFFVGIGFNDDSYYLEFAETLFKNLPFHPTLYVWSVRIGIYFPVVLAWKIFGISEYSTSLFFLACSLGSVVVTYLLGRQLFNTAVGLTAAFLLAVFPLDIVYATQVGPEVPFSLFAGLSILWFLRSYGSDRGYRWYALLSGMGLGAANLFKETFILVPLCCGFYIVCDFIARLRNASGDRLRRAGGFFNKKLFFIGLLFCSGFCIIHLCQNLYFHQVTGEWFFAEKAKAWTLAHDGNKNDDFTFYPRALLNLDKNRFEWIHSKPFFGYFYWAVLAGVLVLAVRRGLSRQALFVLGWLLIFFLFFQYGLHFAATVLADNGMRPRHVRFLLSMSVPAVLFIACAFQIRSKAGAIINVVLMLFLLISSMEYTWQSRLFLRNGMGYIREAVTYLKELESKPVFIPDFWSLSKFNFFAAYDTSFFKRLTVYECGRIDCVNSRYDSGSFIKDAYVVVFTSPYAYINSRKKSPKIYPTFMTAPPSSWQLIKTIDLPNMGIFSKFKPKIYYAPG